MTPQEEWDDAMSRVHAAERMRKIDKALLVLALVAVGVAAAVCLISILGGL